MWSRSKRTGYGSIPRSRSAVELGEPVRALGADEAGPLGLGAGILLRRAHRGMLSGDRGGGQGHTGTKRRDAPGSWQDRASGPAAGGDRDPREPGSPRDDPRAGAAGPLTARRRRGRAVQPHDARHRERGRRRHLRDHGRGGGAVHGPGDRDLVRARRRRGRADRPLLRGARGDDPDRGEHLLLRLRGVRDLPGVVHRLGPAARVPLRGLDRRGRLGRLRGQPAAPRCSSSARASRRARTTRWSC